MTALDRLGDALHASATADVARVARRRRRRTIAGALAALAIVAAGAALAANALITNEDVAKLLTMDETLDAQKKIADDLLMSRMGGM